VHACCYSQLTCCRHCFCAHLQGYWQNQNGLCQWDALYPGDEGFKLGNIYYTKTQLRSIMAQGNGAEPINKLAFQLIPAKLGARNYELGGCPLPAGMQQDIDRADTIINNRVVPPVGTGRCACCATSSCGYGVSCQDGTGSCGRLLDTHCNSVASELDAWNQHICSTSSPPPRPNPPPSPAPSPPPSPGPAGGCNPTCCTYSPVGWCAAHAADERSWPCLAGSGLQAAAAITC
jgi:hypothetical protein